MRTGRLLLALCGLLALGCASILCAGAPADPVQILRQAFASAQASALRPLLPGDSRVYLALPLLRAREGYVGADQALRLFQDLFDRKIIRSFSVPGEQPPAAGQRWALRTEWRIEDGRGGEDRAIVLLELSIQDDRWILREIRAAGP